MIPFFASEKNNMHRIFVIFLLVLFFAHKMAAQVIPIPTDTASVNLPALAHAICSNPALPTSSKVRQVVEWTNQNFHWNYTDYQKRTVKQIICRKGGNCNEQAMVVRALFKELGIKNRRMVEINIQPESERRQQDAEKKVAEIGNRMSVFGLRHNDHVWTEFFDEETQSWQPADPTLNLIGLEDWLKARVGFSERKTHEIVSSRDMLVPIAVFALDAKGNIVENRSEHYLIRSFDAVYQNKISAAPIWKKWQDAIQFINPVCRNAFEGKENLHLHTNKINEIKGVYTELKNWYYNAYAPWEILRQGEKPQLMILGTFHFKDSGLDGYKPKFSVNILSEKRQQEVDDLVNRLAAFKPTKIAIEWKKEKDQRFVDSLYGEYLAGRYQLGQNEIYQVCFRLGKKLGHKQLYCVDTQARWFEDVPEEEPFAKQYGLQKYADTTYGTLYQKLYETDDSLKTVTTLREHLLYVNSPERLQIGHGHYLTGSFKYAAEGEYPGADNATGWYNRNLRILANVLQLAESPGDRIFLLIGAGHLPIIKHAATATPEIKYVEASEYLK
ncbi:MAG: transglutaminase domain-containing protein [Saprospiraceae bacterium]|nr:transglutaminase domain-containing protein [Saprospiraceae bacterium]